MILKGSDLIFVSRILRDGSGTEPLSPAHRKIIQDENLNVNRLSISQDTWIANGFNSYVVKMKSRTKKRLKL